MRTPEAIRSMLTSRVVRYGGAFLFVAAATLLMMAAGRWLAEDPSVAFLAAVVLTAWLLGTGPGIFAVALSALSQGRWFIAPDLLFVATWEQGAALATWCAEGVLVCVLFGSLNRQRGTLARSERRYRLLFDRSPVPKLLYEVATLRILAANDAAVRCYGYSHEELLGLTTRDLAEDGSLRESLEGAEVSARHRRKDGSTIAVEITTHAVGLRTPSRLAVVRDVTRRKELEEQLRQAQKMEAVGRLAGGVAHDFNNLLSVIGSYAQLTLDELDEGSELRELVGEIQKASERAAQLTRQLLVFSRQEVRQPRSIDLNETLVGSGKMLRRLVGENVVLEMTPAARAVPVYVDPGGIEQVLMNLVVNARDAMSSGGTIRVETGTLTLDQTEAQRYGCAPGEYAKLTVADEGAGMDSATRLRIFEPFFTTKPAGKGTGLGLAMAFGMVEEAGGAIHVASAVGAGSTFTILLPLCGALSHAPPANDCATLPRGSETVLLVEDDDDVRATAACALRKLGYRVIEAANGGEALLICEHESQIDVLLTDVVMPYLDGPALAERLARTRPEMKVVCMSGYAGSQATRERLENGGLTFCPKPFTPQSLSLALRKVLSEPAKHAVNG
ncbi:MAG TPA: ATP-binding protein [Polyangiaceae bacterium]|jgi:hypothetical protein